MRGDTSSTWELFLIQGLSSIAYPYVYKTENGENIDGFFTFMGIEYADFPDNIFVVFKFVATSLSKKEFFDMAKGSYPPLDEFLAFLLGIPEIAEFISATNYLKYEYPDLLIYTGSDLIMDWFFDTENSVVEAYIPIYLDNFRDFNIYPPVSA